MDLQKTALIALFSIAALTATAQRDSCQKDDHSRFLKRLTDKTFTVVTKVAQSVGDFFVRDKCDKGEESAILYLSNMAAGRYMIKTGPGEEPLVIGAASPDVLKSFTWNKPPVLKRATISALMANRETKEITGCWKPCETDKPPLQQSLSRP